MRKVFFAPDAEVAKKTVKKHCYNYLLHFPLLFPLRVLGGCQLCINRGGEKGEGEVKGGRKKENKSSLALERKDV